MRDTGIPGTFRRHRRDLPVSKGSIRLNCGQASPKIHFASRPSERLAARYHPSAAKARMDYLGIKAKLCRVGIMPKRCAGYMQPSQSGISRHIPPKSQRPSRIRQLGWPVDQKNGFTVDADIARVGEGRQQRAEVRLMICTARIGLLDQNAVRSPVPYAGPSLVRPAQTERKIRRARGKNFVEGAF